ncbi:acylphosphatase [Phormidium sp. CCY1219]|uniref:acylphosphatase n=1 Tax=Phormidium sp. CCY1219 TaxID=2886104 RepID=UPI002D1E8445|nr:acylphosphatase [Phormidium sp. CCY1219]MEB3830323.1 acylphosphatase [Phormidium sp. CCY1219]
MSEKVAAQVFISGQVQGVGFRFSTVNEAKQNGVTGWVRNLPDGRVEAVFEGSKNAVEKMIQWSHQGPSSAVVQNVSVDYQEPQGFSDFQTRY